MIPSYKSILKGAGIFGAARSVSILTALVRTKCAACFLGTIGVGLNALFFTVQTFTSQVMGLGLPTGSVKTLSEAYATDDQQTVRHITGRVRMWAVLCAVVSFLLLALCSPLLSLLYFDNLHYLPHFILLGVGVGATILCDIEQSVLRSVQATSRLALCMLLTALCGLFFTVPFYYWLGVRGVILAIVFCAVASAMVSLWIGHKVCPWCLDWRLLRPWRVWCQQSLPMLRTGFAFVVTALFLQGSELLLQSVLATTASLSVVGLFRAGYQCAFTYPSMIFAGVGNDYFPRLAAVPESDAVGRREVIVRQIRVMFLLALPVVLGIWWLAPWVIQILLSPEFLPLVPMVRWAIFALLCQAICLPLGYVPLALNRRMDFMLLEAVSCLVRIVMVLGGYHLGGLCGVGQGLLLGSLIELAFYLVFFRIRYRLRFFTLSTLNSQLSTLNSQLSTLPMRILFTTAWYPNRKVAGDGVFIQKHAQAIARFNEVAVLMVQTDEAIRGLRIESEEVPLVGKVRGVLVYVPKIRFEWPVITGLLRLMWLMAGYLKGYRYIKQHYWQGHRPDVCHVNVLTRAAGLPWLLYKLHGIPYIITEHWSRYAREGAYPQSGMQLRLGRRFVRDAAYVCPVSLNLEQAMKKWGLDNKHYTRIGNVVDTELFTPIDPPTKREGFLHVSWMRDDSKNISGILRVLARLKAEGLDFRMDFIGEGNDKEVLIHYAQELGLDDVCTFLPAATGQALATALRSHSALVMFSHFENQPVSVLEALACGLPVIATAVGAIPSMLAQHRGLMVQPGQEDQLFDTLRSFILLQQRLTPEQRNDATLAESRHQYVVEHHSPEVIARNFDVLYRAALAKR